MFPKHLYHECVATDCEESYALNIVCRIIIRKNVALLQLQSCLGDNKNTVGSFKCYVTLEGVGGYMSKRYEALRGGGGFTSALRNVFFF